MQREVRHMGNNPKRHAVQFWSEQKPGTSAITDSLRGMRGLKGGTRPLDFAEVTTDRLDKLVQEKTRPECLGRVSPKTTVRYAQAGLPMPEARKPILRRAARSTMLRPSKRNAGLGMPAKILA